MEFDLIQQYFSPLGLDKTAEQACIDHTDIGIGDDGAVLSIPDGHQLVVVTDTLVSGVHFPENTSAYDIAWKALAVNLSDLAAMGATPFAYSLGLSLPVECAGNEQWMADFSRGLADLVKSTGLAIALVGGDTTRSSVLTLTVSAKGFVKRNKAVLRSGAQMGDLIAVTGVIGEGALGLQLALGQTRLPLTEQERQTALNHLNRPQPQLSIGLQLPEFASSAIDISDGLLQDLGHVLKSSARKSALLGRESNFGACIHLQDIPLSYGMQSLLSQQVISEQAFWQMPLSGGDDYQLCITFDPEYLPELQQCAQQTGVAITVIGEITATGKVEMLLNGEPWQLDNQCRGFQHF